MVRRDPVPVLRSDGPLRDTLIGDRVRNLEMEARWRG